MITPALLLTTLCAASKMPITMFQVFVTISTAQKVLNTHLKNIQVSISWRLFRSVTIWISSTHMTKVRITPAMGTMTVSERFWIMEKTPPFQPWGVFPTSPTISPTLVLTESNIPVKFPLMPSVSSPRSHWSSLSRISDFHPIRSHPRFLGRAIRWDRMDFIRNF